MSLLLLFSGGNPAAGASTADPYVQVLLETENNVFADVSADLRNGSITRGRQAELARYQAGTCTLELSNEDRAYDSTVHSYIKPGRRLKVFAAYGGITYPQFTGKVDGWAERSNGPTDAIAVVSATDRFKDLNKADLPPSAYAAEVEADSPVAWWRLGDPEDQRTGWDRVGTRHMTYQDTPQKGDPLISRDSNASTTFEHTDGNRAEYLGGNVVTATPFTIEGVFRIPVQSDDIFRVIYDEEYAPDGSALMQVAVEENAGPYPGQLSFFFDTPASGDSTFIVSNGRVDDNLIHHFAVVAAGPSDVKLYVDGVEQTNVVFANPFVVPSTRYGVSLGNQFPISAGQYGMDGSLQDVAVYDYALPVARIAAHVETVSTPWNNDLPGERLERIADFLGLPEADRDFDTGSSVLQSATLGGTALEHVQKVAESEFGYVFVTADGKLRFLERHAILNQSSRGTFSDQPAAALVYKDSTPRYDDSLIRNPVTISRSEGVAQTASDQDLIDEYGIYSFSLDGLLYDSDDLSLDAAEFILSEYKEPKRRIENVVIGPVPVGKEAAMYPQMLGRELTEKVTVTEWPQSVGSVISQESIIENIQQSFGPKFWVTTWTVSPALAGAWWQIGVPGFSEIGVSTRVYF